MSVNVVVVVGNPKPRGSTWDIAHRIGGALGEVTASFDLVEFGAPLLGWGDDAVKAAVAEVSASDVVVFATPTYKAAYTGVLKAFLDKFDGRTGLQGVVAVPVQTGGSDAHRLSPEVHLKPVLAELGATVPAPALYVSTQPEGTEAAEREWLERWAPVIGLVVRSS